jgi:hypothetical protein
MSTRVERPVTRERGQAAAKRETDSVSPAPALETGETGSRKKRLDRLPASAEARFWARVDKTETCWLWTATLNGSGYGQITIGRKNWMAHRVAYSLVIGPIPEGLEVDHLCRVRSCVNPEHLEPVDHRTNMLRSPVTELHADCYRGHPLTEGNLLIFADGLRRCAICRRERARKSWAKRQQLAEQRAS